MLLYFETFLPLVKSFDLLDKMRYILWVVALLKDCDVTKNGRHLGRRLEFYQEIEIRLKPREMVLSSKSQFDPTRKRTQPLRECGVLSFSLSDHAMVCGIRKLNWMKVFPQKQRFSGIMQNTTLQSFVKTLEVLIGLIV